MNKLAIKELHKQIDDQIHELKNLSLSLHRSSDPITSQYIISRMQNRSAQLHIRTAHLGTGLAEQGRKEMGWN
ncbi:hypothetical protein [Limosilactobacillus sp.]|uniref:hypothetical protein n=1 Tax=Limosilactobacillus sp. TaxID=2773925 RepID=UPI003F050FC0